MQHILGDVSLDNGEARDYLNSMDNNAKRNIADLKELIAKLKEMQTAFFTEIKTVADKVNIEMPEPSEIDLIRDSIADPKEVLTEYCEKKGLNTPKHIGLRRDAAEIIEDIFRDVSSVFNSISGTLGYQSEIADELESLLNVGEIHLNDDLKYHSDTVYNTFWG